MLNTAINAIPYPQLTDIPNIPSHMQGMALAIDTKLVARFATAAARSTAIPTPIVGMITFRADAAAPGFEYWNGSSWASINTGGQPTLTAVQGADLAVAGTGLTNSGLTFGTEAAKNYIAEYTLFYSADTGADAKIDFTGPSGMTFRGMFQSAPSDVTDVVTAVYMGASTTTSGIVLGGRGTGTPLAARLCVTFYSGSGGNIRLRFAKNVAAGGDSTLLQASSVKVTRD